MRDSCSTAATLARNTGNAGADEPGLIRLDDGGRRGADVGLGQVQRKCASLSGRAAELDLAAQQVGQFAADGESQSGSAVLAAGAGIGLLECLEDDPLFFRSEFRCRCPTPRMQMTEPAPERIG